MHMTESGPRVRNQERLLLGKDVGAGGSFGRRVGGGLGKHVSKISACSGS